MTDVVDWVLEEMGQLPLWAVLVTVCVVMALETTMFVGVVVPGDIVVLFAASTGRTVPELVLLVAAVTLGSLTGETVGYELGRRWGTRLRASRAGQRLGEEKWDRAAGFLHDRGGRAVFLARYLAAVHAVTPIVAGTVGMRYRRFIAWCAAGGVTWSTLYVVVGVLAGASYRKYADSIGTATSVVIGGLIGAGVFLAAAWVRNRGPLRPLPRLVQALPRVSLPVPRLRGQLGALGALGPLGRQLWAWDVGLVALLAGGVVVTTATVDEVGSRSVDGLAHAVAVAGVVVLLGRRRWPIPVLAATVVAFSAYNLLDYPAGPPVVAVVVAVYGAARAGYLSPALVAGGLVTGSGIAYRWLVEGDNVLGVETALGAVLLMAVALVGDARQSPPARAHHLPPLPDPTNDLDEVVDVRDADEARFRSRFLESAP